MLQPDDRLDIQVVGRFVHQQDIRPSQQHTRQRDAHFPPARERTHVAVDLIILETQAVEHLTGLRLQQFHASFADPEDYWNEALRRYGPSGFSPEFLSGVAAFIRSGCESVAKVCPRTAKDRELVDVLAIRVVNEGMSTTFLPFDCPPSP